MISVLWTTVVHQSIFHVISMLTNYAKMFLPGFQLLSFFHPKKRARSCSSISKPTEQPKLRTFWGMVAQPGQTSSWKMRRNTAKNRPEDKKCRKHHLNQDFSKVVACPLGVSDVARVIEPMPIDKKTWATDDLVDVNFHPLKSALQNSRPASWQRSPNRPGTGRIACLHVIASMH